MKTTELQVLNPLRNPHTGRSSTKFWYAGAIDLVDGECVIDWKSASDISTFQDKKSVGFQPECYALALAYLENVHASSQNGCKGNWKLSESFACIRSALEVARIPYVLASPQRWMKRLQPLPAGTGKQRTARKAAIKALMKERYPALANKITLATADALAIMDYGLEQEGVSA